MLALDGLLAIRNDIRDKFEAAATASISQTQNLILRYNSLAI